MTTIIGIAGGKYSGKSTVANYIAKYFNGEVIPTIRPMINMMYALGITPEELVDNMKEIPNEKLCGATPTHAMQTLGLEWGRKCIHEDIWINLWEKEIQNKKLVIADNIRFQNEVDRIRALGGTVIRIRRPGYDGLSSHESEVSPGFINVDNEFINSDDMKTLIDCIVGYLTDYSVLPLQSALQK